MDFSASSHALPTNSRLPRFGQQSGRTRTNNTPSGITEQRPLLLGGQSTSEIPSADIPIADRSLDVVDNHYRRQSDGLVRRTTTAQPSPSDSGGLNVRFEEGDITIDDAEFRQSVISFHQQLSKSYHGLKYLNNPEFDRTEFTERGRFFSYNVFMCSGYAVTGALLLYATFAILDHLGLAYNTPDRKIKGDLLPLWLICYSSAILLTVGLTPLFDMLSYYLANNVAAVVDAYEKKVASTSDESATEQFLKKYDRMESLLDRLNKLRSSTYLTKKHRKSVRNLPKLVVNVTDCGIDGKPLRHVAMEEKPKLNRLERMDFSFYFSGVKKNRRNLEAAIVKTRNWLDRAEKQVRLIRGDYLSGATGR